MKRTGFTLVELLAVVGIVGLLLALLMPAVQRSRRHSETIQCAAALRELFLAHSAYADQNDGRYARVAYGQPWQSWLGQLAPLLSEAPRGVRRLTLCPSIELEAVDEGASAYGVNACINMPAWSARAGARFDTSRIILMGEKAVNTRDFLTSTEGIWFVRLEDGCISWWLRSLGHPSVRPSATAEAIEPAR
ncbi:MAG: type II secretion system protein [Phycisphaerales bacterium]|nr:type II secretion system protein [Phycisphaerales bacterium]